MAFQVPTQQVFPVGGGIPSPSPRPTPSALGAFAQGLSSAVGTAARIAETMEIAKRNLEQKRSRRVGRELWVGFATQSATFAESELLNTKGNQSAGVTDQYTTWANERLGSMEFPNEETRGAFMQLAGPLFVSTVQNLARHEATQERVATINAHVGVVKAAKHDAVSNSTSERSVEQNDRIITDTIVTSGREQELTENEINENITKELSELYETIINVNMADDPTYWTEDPGRAALLGQYRENLDPAAQLRVAAKLQERGQDGEVADVVAVLMGRVEGGTITLKQGEDQIKSVFDTKDPARKQALSEFRFEVSALGNRQANTVKLNNHTYMTSVFEKVKAGDLPAATAAARELVGSTQQKAAREMIQRAAGGFAVDYDLAIDGLLQQLAAEDPFSFVRIDLTQVASRLSQDRYKHWVGEQNKVAGGAVAEAGYEREITAIVKGQSLSDPDIQRLRVEITRELGEFRKEAGRRLKLGEVQSIVGALAFSLGVFDGRVFKNEDLRDLHQGGPSDAILNLLDRGDEFPTITIGAGSDFNSFRDRTLSFYAEQGRATGRTVTLSEVGIRQRYSRWIAQGRPELVVE